MLIEKTPINWKTLHQTGECTQISSLNWIEIELYDEKPLLTVMFRYGCSSLLIEKCSSILLEI